MTTLFDILEGIVENAGDMVNDRAVVESALQPAAVSAYSEGALDIFLSSEQEASISEVGLKWVRNVNEGNGEWGDMRMTAELELSEEV